MFNLTASIHKGTKHNREHNLRLIPVPHSDKSRHELNEVFVDIPIRQAYHELFDEALAEYNEGKKPSRQIPDYYEHILKQFNDGEERLHREMLQGASRKRQARIRSTYPKPCYELIVSLGNIEAYNGAFRNGGENEELALASLREYLQGFSERNPNLYVTNAVLHRDEEGVGHLHIAYISWTDEPTSRGLKKRVSESGAFKAMGLGDENKFGTIAFQERERKALTDIARKHDINVIEGKHTKKHLEKEEYILEREQEKVGKAAKAVNEGARQLIEQQDEFSRFVQNRQDGTDFIEAQVIKTENAEYHDMVNADSQRIAEAWTEFKAVSADYFDNYKKTKKELKAEIDRAKNEKTANQSKVNALLNSLLFDSDFFIIKVAKLFSLMYHYVKGKNLDYEVKSLQKSHIKLKSEAKQVLALTDDTATELRNAEYDRLAQSLNDFENAVERSMGIIKHIQEQVMNNDEIER